MKEYNLKKVIKRLFIFFIYISNFIYIGSAYPENDIHKTNINSKINWWSLGEEFKHSPALGFSLITFIIFIGIAFYYSKKRVNRFFHKRHLKIKKRINKNKIFCENAEYYLSRFEKKKKLLDFEIKEF